MIEMVIRSIEDVFDLDEHYDSLLELYSSLIEDIVAANGIQELQTLEDFRGMSQVFDEALDIIKEDLNVVC